MDINEDNLNALREEKLERVRQLFGNLSVALYALKEVHETMGKTISAMREVNDKLLNATWAQVLVDGAALEVAKEKAGQVDRLQGEIERLRGLLVIKTDEETHQVVELQNEVDRLRGLLDQNEADHGV